MFGLLSGLLGGFGGGGFGGLPGGALGAIPLFFLFFFINLGSNLLQLGFDQLLSGGLDFLLNPDMTNGMDG